MNRASSSDDGVRELGAVVGVPKNPTGMSREYVLDYLLPNVCISASQEEILSSIPGWEEIGGTIDDSPSLPSPSQSSQQRIFDVTGSSSSDDHDLSQKAVEWASPVQTPVASSRAAVELESYHEPFDSDRSASPKRRQSWGFSRPGDLTSPESDQQNSAVKVVSIVDAEYGAAEEPPEDKQMPAVASSAQASVIAEPHGRQTDLEGSMREVDEKVDSWGQLLPPASASEDEAPSCPPAHSERAQVTPNTTDSSPARKIVGKSSELQLSSAKAICLDNGRVCAGTSATANQNTDGLHPQANSRDSARVSSGKTSNAASFPCASSDSKGEQRVEAPMPSEAVQEKLRNLRRLAAENATGNESRKRARGDEHTLRVPATVMDVVKQRPDRRPAQDVSAADLLSAAIRAGVTLPPPFGRHYFRSQ